MKTILSNGDVSQYGFMCGYIQSVEIFNIRVKLEFTHGSFDLKIFNFNNHKILYWGATNKLVIGRTAYNFIKKRLESVVPCIKGRSLEDFISYCETYPHFD